MTPLVSSALAIDLEGRLILGRRSREPGIGGWLPPGGKVKGRETLAEAVRREFMEETGLAIVVMGRPGAAGIFEFDYDGQWWTVVYSFAAVAAGVVGGRGLAESDVDMVDAFTQKEVQALGDEHRLAGTCAEALRLNGWLAH